MKRTIIVFFGMLLLVYAAGRVVYGEDLSVKDILKHADRARGNVGGIVWNLTITSSEEGSDTSRELVVKAKKNNVLAKYTSPRRVSDQTVLMVDRNMWFMRSGLSKPVSLSPRQKLLGDASNGDIASTNYAEDYAPTLLREESVKGETCYVFDLKAIKKNVTYDKIKYWVSKNRLVGVKAEFYTLSGKLFKNAGFKYDNEITIDKETIIPFVSEIIIRDAIQNDKITTMTYSHIIIEEIPDSTFNLNVLLR